MRKLISGIWILAAAPTTILLASGTAMAADQSIDEFEAVQQAAWNAHDSGAYTSTFDKDAEIVTSLGWHWSGQTEAARNLGDGFKFVYARARLRLSDVRVRNLTPELASVTLRWSIDGARTINSGLQAKEQHGFETQLLKRLGESWLILAQQDTATSSQSPEQVTTPASTFPLTPPPVRRCIVGRKNGECYLYGKPKPAPAS